MAATSSAVKSASAATSAAVKSAASATASFGRRQKSAAAAKMYERCKLYIANYDKAMSLGQDVTELVQPDADEIISEVKEEMPNPAGVPSSVTAKLRNSRRKNRLY